MYTCDSISREDQLLKVKAELLDKEAENISDREKVRFETRPNN